MMQRLSVAGERDRSEHNESKLVTLVFAWCTPMGGSTCWKSSATGDRSICEKKFAQVRKSERNNLILAIPERITLEKAGVDVKTLPARVVWFKSKLQPKAVLDVLGEE